MMQTFIKIKLRKYIYWNRWCPKQSYN